MYLIIIMHFFFLIGILGITELYILINVFILFGEEEGR